MRKGSERWLLPMQTCARARSIFLFANFVFSFDGKTTDAVGGSCEAVCDPSKYAFCTRRTKKIIH